MSKRAHVQRPAGIRLVLVAAMVIWSLVMPYLIHNNIQDWLERGYWGKTKIASEKYKTSDLKLLELKKALTG